MIRVLALAGVMLFSAPPAAGQQAPPPPSGTEFRFTTTDGVTVYGDAYTGWRGKAGPTVLLFHQGGGDARGEYGGIVPVLLREGFNALAVDARLGGPRFGGNNRTAAGVDSTKYGYCDAYPDVAGALAYVDTLGYGGPRFLWGSSYTAALVVQAAARMPGRMAGVLAFSPASGGPLAGCEPEPYLTGLEVPVFILRPKEEMQHEWIARQFETFRRAGARSLVVENGVHGSSMLNPERIKGDPTYQWSQVSDFLRDHSHALPELTRGAVERRVAVESDGWKLQGDLLRAGGRTGPAVLMLNKTAGDRDVYRALARLLAGRGIHSLRLDLPGHGESINRGVFVPGAPNAELHGSRHDVAAALAFLRRQLGVDTSRIGVVAGGYSGEFAAEAGRHGAPADAYVMFSPGSFSDSSAAWIGPSGAGWLFLRSTDERFVKEWLDDRVKAGGAAAEVRVVPGSVHATDILWAHPEVAEQVAEWLAARLRS